MAIKKMRISCMSCGSTELKRLSSERKVSADRKIITEMNVYKCQRCKAIMTVALMAKKLKGLDSGKKVIC